VNDQREWKDMSEPEPSGKPPLREIFLKAMDLSVASERQAYLERACEGNAALLARIQALLDNHTNDDFLEDPAVQVTATKTVPYDLPGEPTTEIIGRYKLLQKIGEGGCGVVYMAQQDEPVRRTVALKVIKLGMDTKQVIARFEAERQALAMMDHPNIAKVLDAGTTEKGRPYFVMELVRGIKITAYCDQNKLTPLVRLDLFMKVCQAIQHAHQKGIIHRDIKPSNILVTLHDGVPVPKVIDFGIAKATEGRLTNKTLFTAFEQFIGTPAYMSPEQAEMSGLDIDTRADIYSLGVLLYELLTGKPPFDGKELLASGLEEMRRTIREREPVRPSARLSTMLAGELTTTAQHRGSVALKLVSLVKGDLDWIVMKALEKDRTRRYETASGLAADLKRYLDSEPVNARPPSPLYRLQKGLRRNRGLAIAAAVVLLALVGGLGLSTAALVREKQARARQAAADRAKAAETIRADAVAGLVTELFTSLEVHLDRRGNVRALQQMAKAADQLVSTSLSNSPSAGIRILQLVGSLIQEEPRGEVQRLDRIAELLPRVSDEQLGVPRYQFALERVMAVAGLDFQRAAAELASLHLQVEEARRQLHPDQLRIARTLWTEAVSYYKIGQDELGEQRGAETLQSLPADAEPAFAYEVRVAYLLELMTSGKYGEVERVGRQGLRDPKTVPAALGNIYGLLVYHISCALSAQGRFAEADALVREQTQGLREANHSPTVIFKLERRRAEVWARAFQPQKALPMLYRNATNANASAWDWNNATSVALGMGDMETYQSLCVLALVRYVSGIEHGYVDSFAIPLLLHPQDEIMTKVLIDLVERAESSGMSYVTHYIPHMRAWLEYRLGRYSQAHDALDQVAKNSTGTTYWGRRIATFTKPFFDSDHYLRAMLFAKEGRIIEAQTSFATARKLIGPDPAPNSSHDLGSHFAAWYQAAAARREAEQVFREKGIAVPQPL